MKKINSDIILVKMPEGSRPLGGIGVGGRIILK
jgi:hypothetical protein